MKKLLSLFILGGLTLGACEDDHDHADDPNHDHEEELITTLKLNFTDSAGNHPSFTAQFADPDGPGGNAPTITDTIWLKENTTYNVTMEVWNESESPAEDLTSEVLSEGDEHFVCFTPTTTLTDIMHTDSDGTHTIGLSSKWRTSTQSNGTTQVQLKHQDGGSKDGTCTPGDSDIDVTFETRIQQ